MLEEPSDCGISLTPVEERGKERGLNRKNLRLQCSFKKNLFRSNRSCKAKIPVSKVLNLTGLSMFAIVIVAWAQHDGKFRVQQLGPLVNYIHHSRRSEIHIFTARTEETQQMLIVGRV